MATYKTLEDLEKAAREGKSLQAVLKSALDKVVKVKQIRFAASSLYMTGDLDPSLVKEVRKAGHKIIEFSLALHGSHAFISGGSATAFLDASRKSGVRLLSVRDVNDVAAALRSAQAK